MHVHNSDHLKAAPVVIRVGVTGHRLEGLEKNGFDQTRLRDDVRKALKIIRETAERIFRESRGAGNPVLRVISPLAEGADRFVATEGLALGYELQVPLPFHREEYENDFASQESKNDFGTLLEKAASVLELNGSRNLENEAYETVGRQVLGESDVLIAIWNGEPAAGRGGTGQIAREALSRGIPTVWISPYDPIGLLDTIHPNRRESIDLLPSRIQRSLRQHRVTKEG